MMNHGDSMWKLTQSPVPYFEKTEKQKASLNYGARSTKPRFGAPLSTPGSRSAIFQWVYLKLRPTPENLNERTQRFRERRKGKGCCCVRFRIRREQYPLPCHAASRVTKSSSNGHCP